MNFSLKLAFFLRHQIGPGYISYGSNIHPMNVTGDHKLISVYSGRDIIAGEDTRIYYRESTNENILRMVNKDINSRSSVNFFFADRVFICTWDEIYSNNSDMFFNQSATFQLALATNGVDTYAVMNYERLGKVQADTIGFTESDCGNYHLENNRNGSMKITTTNSTKRGQHIFHLTQHKCIKNNTDSPIKAIQFKVNAYNNMFRMSQNLMWSYPLDMQIFVTSLVTNHPAPAMVYPILGGYWTDYNRFEFAYLNMNRDISRWIGNYSITTMQQNILGVSSDSERTKDFQYDVLHFLNVSLNAHCERFTFVEPFDAAPVVIVTPMIHTSSEFEFDFVNVWIKDVDRKAFTACVKESIAFTGPRAVEMTFIATSKFTNSKRPEEIHEARKVMVNGDFRENKHCQEVEFEYRFEGNPIVVSSVEVIGNHMNDSVISWIKNVDSKSAEVCVMAENAKGMTFIHNVIAVGKVDPCNDFWCPGHLECSIDYMDQPFCGCKKDCTRYSNETFCGSDLRTYRSMCHLQQEHCIRYGNMSQPSVTKVHQGECIGK